MNPSDSLIYVMVNSVSVEKNGVTIDEIFIPVNKLNTLKERIRTFINNYMDNLDGKESINIDAMYGNEANIHK